MALVLKSSLWVDENKEAKRQQGLQDAKPLIVGEWIHCVAGELTSLEVQGPHTLYHSSTDDDSPLFSSSVPDHHLDLATRMN